MRKNFTIVFIAFFATFTVSAQTLPSTDIFLISLTKADTGYVLGDATQVTDWNGYDNQPSFSFDSQNIYYVSGRSELTDVYMYSIVAKQNFAFIETPSLSEYSPMLTNDGRGITVLRQGSTENQQVWKHFLDGNDPVCLTPDFRNVGYYCFTSEDGMVITREVNDTTRKLEWYNMKAKTTKPIATKFGVSICKVPAEQAVYYIDNSKKQARLMKYSVETNTSDSLTTVPDGVENFTTTIEGEVWLINKGVLYSWSPATPAQWKKVYSFSGGLLNGAYRLATSRDMRWLAVVVKRND